MRGSRSSISWHLCISKTRPLGKRTYSLMLSIFCSPSGFMCLIRLTFHIQHALNTVYFSIRTELLSNLSVNMPDYCNKMTLMVKKKDTWSTCLLPQSLQYNAAASCFHDKYSTASTAPKGLTGRNIVILPLYCASVFADDAQWRVTFLYSNGVHQLYCLFWHLSRKVLGTQLCIKLSSKRPVCQHELYSCAARHISVSVCPSKPSLTSPRPTLQPLVIMTGAT